MNEATQKILTDMIQRALNGIDAAVEFGQQEIPIIIQQLLTWHFAEAAIKSTLGLATVIAVVYVLVKFSARKKVDPEQSWRQNCRQPNLFFDENGDLCPRTIFTIMSVAFALLLGVGLLRNIFIALKILIAPKLYLLEYGAALIK